jgi:hypothetical protein
MDVVTRAKVEQVRGIVKEECNKLAMVLMGDTPPGNEMIHKELELVESSIGNRIALEVMGGY